jgi:cytochrome bd-type quinol oxidase subunit 2
VGFGAVGVALALSLGVGVGSLIATTPATEPSLASAWLPVLCGTCSLAVLTLQSAAWNALKSSGELQQRCRRLESQVWWAVLASYAAVTAAAFISQPHFAENLLTHTSLGIVAVLALTGLIAARMCLSVGFDLGAFAGASCMIVGLLASVAAGQFPYLLNHTVYDAGTAPQGMLTAALWWIPPFVLAAGYHVYLRVGANALNPVAGSKSIA